jgi:hypothetical protein
MKSFGKLSIVALTALLVIAVSAALATGGKTGSTASILKDEKVAPFVDDASAVIYASGLVEGSLFQLRGAAGRAWFTRKGDGDNWCDVAVVRLLAGDFGGNTVGISRTEPVVLIVLNPEIATRLSQGQEIVSGDFDLLNVDQVAEHGLSGVDILFAGSGRVDGNYILNPGRSLLNDIFGASSTGNVCEHDSAYAAIAEE